MGASAVIGYLLDSNTVVFWLSRRQPSVVRKAGEHRRESALSAIVIHELCFGAFAGTRTQETLDLYGSTGLPVVPFEQEDARVAAEVRATLRHAGTPIGPYDVLIAGQALARDLTLVTNNVREFARVPGLKLADWTAD
jgi:tRNA(fMet)-specific endonuclease VapC